MRIRLLPLVVLGLMFGSLPGARAQVTSIMNSPHNLSAMGPGRIRAATEGEVCVFCHTPHNSSPVQPLWNRMLPASAYTVYSSNSLVASPGQPTGSSKLCLSCHDGTIAIGSVLSREQPIAMVGGITTLPPGASNLGTDLSDDHPISFRYDTALAQQNVKLRSPEALPQQIKLDPNGELQCTSCHNAHDNSLGKFLVMDNTSSQLCNSCHNEGATTVAGHAQCNSCHQPHTAPSGPYLLRGKTFSTSCLLCHSGGTGANQGPNIASDVVKLVNHDTNPDVRTRLNTPAETSCADCHEPHTMVKATALAPLVSPRLGAIGGVNSGGATIPRAQYEYEVCYKCHDANNTVPLAVSRQITQVSTRLQFSPSSVSYHPVQVAGRNTDVPSLKPGYTTQSIINCSDCHGSDSSAKSGGSGANGPHGSNVNSLLLAQYRLVSATQTQVSENATAYALCYRCHDRTNLMSDKTFLHHKHVQDSGAPCSTCHDAHGIAAGQGTLTGNSKLINFATSVVQPISGQTLATYTNLGYRRGSCTLVCHSKTHNNLAYNRAGGIEPAPLRRIPGPVAPRTARPAPTPPARQPAVR